MRTRLPPVLERTGDRAHSDSAEADGTRRPWARDAERSTGADESRRLGWLDVVDRQHGRRGLRVDLCGEPEAVPGRLLAIVRSALGAA